MTTPTTTFDLCPEYVFARTSERKAVRNEGVIHTRQVDGTERRSWDLQWDDASHDIANRIESLYASTYGGVLPMYYSPPEAASGTVNVRFGPDPLEIDYSGYRKASIKLTLVEVL